MRFAAGRPVLTARGDCATALLESGQRPCTKNLGNGTLVLAGVLKSGGAGHSSETVQINLPCGVLGCTGTHAFWCLGRGWVRARELALGDALESAEGHQEPILDVSGEELSMPASSYNLQTDGNH